MNLFKFSAGIPEDFLIDFPIALSRINTRIKLQISLIQNFASLGFLEIFSDSCRKKGFPHWLLQKFFLQRYSSNWCAETLLYTQGFFQSFFQYFLQQFFKVNLTIISGDFLRIPPRIFTKILPDICSHYFSASFYDFSNDFFQELLHIYFEEFY